MTSILKAGAIALAASLFALPALAATAPHAKTAHHRLHVASAQHHAAGKIQRINAKAHTLTINHRVYRLTPQFASASFKEGQKVQIVYKKDRGHRLVEKISAVSA